LRPAEQVALLSAARSKLRRVHALQRSYNGLSDCAKIAGGLRQWRHHGTAKPGTFPVVGRRLVRTCRTHLFGCSRPPPFHAAISLRLLILPPTVHLAAPPGSSRVLQSGILT